MKVLSRLVNQILWNIEKRRQLHKLHEHLDCTDSGIFWFYVLPKFLVKEDESGRTEAVAVLIITNQKDYLLKIFQFHSVDWYWNLLISMKLELFLKF